MAYFNQVQTNFNPANLSAFGTLEASDLTPILQGDFVYGLNSQMWNTGVVTGAGATVNTNISRLRIQSGTAATSYAYITSRRILRYRAGQGTLARFTPLFTAGVASNDQYWGIGTIVSNAIYDGYFFGYHGTSYGIAYYNSGAAVNFTAQDSWNVDPMNGTGPSGLSLDPTKGSPVMIKYPYLGYGSVFFYVESPAGSWIHVHTIRYPNTTNLVQLGNPTMQFLGFTANAGNTTNVTMYCGSVGIFISGVRSFIGNPKWGIDNNKSGISSTETCILNLQNCTSYNGVLNRGLCRLNSISIGSPTNNTLITIHFKVGATIGGSPSYTAINGTGSAATITSGNSIMSYDTAGTTGTGGSLIFTIQSGAQGSPLLDLTNFNIIVAPGEILSITASATATSIVGVSVTWTEDI
jgi:hypothetical protein